MFSDYLVSKVFNSKNIKEQKTFVTYPMVAVKALQDVIKGNFTKTYIVDYVFTIVSKQKKNEKLLKYLDNDIMKEKVVLKINYNEYVLNRDKVYELIRNGFKIALMIDKDFELTDENLKLFKLFAYVITDDNDVYNKFKDKFDVLFINS